MASKAQRAYDQRESIDWPMVKELIGDVSKPMPFPLSLLYPTEESFIKSERRKNSKRYAKKFPKIDELVRASVSYTQDTNEPVIHLIAVDGTRVSLWCQGNRIRSITPY